MEKWVERIENVNNEAMNTSTQLPLSDFCRILESGVDNMDSILEDFQNSVSSKTYEDWREFISNFLNLNKIVRNYQNKIFDKLQSRLGYKEINNEYASDLLIRYLEDNGYKKECVNDYYKFTKDNKNDIRFSKEEVCDDLISSIIALVENR